MAKSDRRRPKQSLRSQRTVSPKWGQSLWQGCYRVLRFMLIFLWRAAIDFSRAIIAFIIAIALIVGIEKYQGKQEINLKDYIKFRNLEQLAILTGLGIYFLETPNRRKRTQYEAWQVITSAQGQGGSGGRIQALQDLNAEKVSLAAVSAAKADLTGVKLPHADLERANLSGSKLDRADLHEANLWKVDLSKAIMVEANLSKSKLIGAKLIGATFRGADFSDAILRGTNFSSADLSRVNLRGADLSGANLSDANLLQADLTGAIMHDTNLSEARLIEANLQGADLSGAKLIRTTLIGADLREADLSRANLNGANLLNANLSGASLKAANFEKANLQGANLECLRDYDADAIALAKSLAQATNLPADLSQKLHQSLAIEQLPPGEA
jgi:uncharacterized protein YjbI with pentapeptide repeats